MDDKVNPQVTLAGLAQAAQRMSQENKELIEKNKALALFRKIDDIILSKVTDLGQIAQQVADTIVNELSFKTVVIFLLDGKDNSLIRLAISKTDPIAQAEAKLNQKLFGERIPLTEEENLIVKAVKTQHMQITHGLNNTLTPYFSDEQSKLTQEAIGITASFAYPLVVKDEVIGAMLISINDKEGLSEFKNDLIDRLAGVIGVAIDNALLYQEIQGANLRLKEVDRLKDEFVSIASHELRTPLSAIDGIVSMIRDGEYGPINKELKQPLEDVNTSSERLINLVNDLLNLSRIAAGRMKYTLSDFLIADVITQTLQLLEPVAKQKNLLLTATDLEKSNVQGDIDKVKEILNNLIGNSLKFTDKGSITVCAKAVDGKVEVQVSDTGIGIAKEDQVKLFGQFQQLESGRGRPAGTGLGLHISREMVGKMGGDLWIEKSEKGIGSTFAFSIPKSQSELAKKVRKEIEVEAKAKANPNQRSGTIK